MILTIAVDHHQQMGRLLAYTFDAHVLRVQALLSCVSEMMLLLLAM